MQRIVDATLDAAVVAIVAAILFAFGIVAVALKVWRMAYGPTGKAHLRPVRPGRGHANPA